MESERGAWTNRDELSFIHPSAKTHPSTQVCPYVYIDSGVEIGANCSVGFQGFGFGRLGNKGYRLDHSGGVLIGKNSKTSNKVTVALVPFSRQLSAKKY